MSFYNIKNKYLCSLSPKAPPKLFRRSQAKQGLSGRILCIVLNKHTTKFEVSDFVRVSKKHRSNVVDILVKDIFQYNITGICIRHKKDQFSINTSFLIRNVFDQFPYELNIPFYSPHIDYISILFYRQKLKYLTHSKYYYLRKKPLPQSKVVFDYVVGMYDHDIVDEEVSEFSIPFSNDDLYEIY